MAGSPPGVCYTPFAPVFFCPFALFLGNSGEGHGSARPLTAALLCLIMPLSVSLPAASSLARQKKRFSEQVHHETSCKQEAFSQIVLLAFCVLRVGCPSCAAGADASMTRPAAGKKVSPLLTAFVPNIRQSRSAASGLLHPGIVMTKAQLDTMQRHVRAGDEPWAAAFRRSLPTGALRFRRASITSLSGRRFLVAAGWASEATISPFAWRWTAILPSTRSSCGLSPAAKHTASTH